MKGITPANTNAHLLPTVANVISYIKKTAFEYQIRMRGANMGDCRQLPKLMKWETKVFLFSESE